MASLRRSHSTAHAGAPMAVALALLLSAIRLHLLPSASATAPPPDLFCPQSLLDAFRSPQSRNVQLSCHFDFDAEVSFIRLTSTGLPVHYYRKAATKQQHWDVDITIPGLGPRPHHTHFSLTGGRTLPLDVPIGFAVNGVPLYAAAEPLQMQEGRREERGQEQQHDGCLGFTSPETGAYFYRTAPPCLFGPDQESYNLGSLISAFTAPIAPIPSPIIAIMTDGYPLYGPFDENGELHRGLDDCNGKVVNGSYAYFATPHFPYTIGCFGPGLMRDEALEPTALNSNTTETTVEEIFECPAGMYRSSVTSGCELCPPGTYATSSLTRSQSQSAEAACAGVCPEGHWCGPGTIYPTANPCPAGRYGGAEGLTNSLCSGECEAGFYCPVGSTSPRQRPCGGIEFYCPPGSPNRIRVTDGRYTVADETNVHSLGSWKTEARGAARFADRTTFKPKPQGDGIRSRRLAQQHRSREVLCEPGSWCKDGVKTLCPPATFGATPGLTTANCTGLCPEGHFCVEGSPQPEPCPAGTYGSSMGLSTSMCSGLCAPGFYCPVGSTSPRQERCPSGIAGIDAGLATAACSLACDAQNSGGNEFCVPNVCEEGYFCPPMSTSTQERECGDPSVYCPRGSAEPTPVQPGYYTIGPHSSPGAMQSPGDATTRTSEVPCEPGYFCRGGVKTICPKGYYGAVHGLTTANCSGLCNGGYYCDAGSTTPTQHHCGGASVFCPEGSFQPTPVGPGNYTVVGPSSVRVAETPCPPGSYCESGTPRLCPRGTYGNTSGLDSPLCSGLCLPGYWCPIGSTSETEAICAGGLWGEAGSGTSACSGVCAEGYFCPPGSVGPQQNECGGDTLFCPRGSTAPTNVSIGYYATGGTPRTRSAQEACVVEAPPAGEERRRNVCPSHTMPLGGDTAFYDAVVEAYEYDKEVNEQGVLTGK